MTFEEFLAEIKTDMRQYFEMDIIDDVSVYRWLNQGLKKFGSNIMIYHEKVVDIKNNKGALPENFFSLKHALKCNKDFIKCDKETKPILVKSLFWTDVQLKQTGWNLCVDDCETNNVEEFTIREKTYIDGCMFEKFYNQPVELKLSKAFKKSVCDNECFNKFHSNSPYEINIIGNTIYTNFPEGDVYIKYKGLELDDDGKVVIPDTPKGELFTYLLYFVKRNIIEIALTNGDDTNMMNLFKYYVDAERQQLALALTETKFMTITPDSLYKLKGRNQAERKRFQVFPK